MAACLAEHEHHARALPIMQPVHAKKNQGFVSGHSVLECHAIFTRLPRSPRITPLQAATLIEENIVRHFSIPTLSGKEYSDLASQLGKTGTIGGQSCDALHLACAEKSGANRIFTFNVHDFSELAGSLRDRIAAPQANTPEPFPQIETSPLLTPRNRTSILG